MDNSTLYVLALSCTLVFVIVDNSKTMPNDQYLFLKKNIEDDYRTAISQCTSFSATANKKCIFEAETTRNASKTELSASYK